MWVRRPKSLSMGREEGSWEFTSKFVRKKARESWMGGGWD